MTVMGFIAHYTAQFVLTAGIAVAVGFIAYQKLSEIL